MSLHLGTGQVGGWTAVSPLLLLLFLLTLCATTNRVSAEASTFDAEPLLEKHAQQLSTTELSSTLHLLIDILSEQQEQPQALRQYVSQLQAVLQPDCCDYFTALPTVKGLAAALSGVLYLPLPATLRPVVRRSYVAAIWLLQRSRFFKWDSRALQKAAVSGLDELYEQHMSAASGRPISFHHISKTGGTTLCGVAGDNGCRGPKMSKKNNCLLDPGLDKPVWVLRHNVTVVNNVTAMPPPPPAPPVMADTSASMEAMRQEVAARVAAKFVYDWFMYECPVERLVTAGGVGRSCSELQAGAGNKSATFFASENTLPYDQGSTQVCDAFTNVVVVRDAVSEAVSLMTEVALVYTRLLKQHKVLGWSPPKHDLAWWQQWAPAVVNSYAARTLLGPAAFCPAASAAATTTTPALSTQQPDSPPAPGGRSSSSSSTSGSSSRDDADSNGSDAFALRERDVQAALKLLATFDVVLDLGSAELMDTSLNKLLGWTAKKLSDGRQQRTNHVLRTPSWETLELLAVQEAPPPPPPPSGVIIRNSPSIKKQSEVSRRFASKWPPIESSQEGVGDVSAAAGQQQGLDEDEQQEGEEVERGQQENQAPSAPAPAAVLSAAEADELRRMLAEVRVRGVYTSHGMSHVLLPLQPDTPLLRPSEAVIGAAMTALTAARYAPLKASYVADSSSSNHLVVELELGQPPPTSTSSTSSTNSKSPAASAPPAAGTEFASTTPTYHVWLRHGVLLTVPQYEQLLRSTAGDALLYQHGRVLQALDAGMGAVLGGQRKVRRMLSHVQEEVKDSCGFAGVKFPKAS